MPLIHLTTFIKASAKTVFDLSRSVDLHLQSMNEFEEKVVEGKKSGYLELGDEIVWEAKHLYKKRSLKIKITALDFPHYFCDEQIRGDFKKLKHQHFFKPCENGTIIIDYFYFEAPYGVLGKMIDKVYLTRYMRRLLENRNCVIKTLAEKSNLV